MLDVIQVRACAERRNRGAKVDRLHSKDGDWGGVLGRRDLNDKRDRDQDETQQSEILYGGGSNGWVLSEVFCSARSTSMRTSWAQLIFRAGSWLGLLHGFQGSRECLDD